MEIRKILSAAAVFQKLVVQDLPLRSAWQLSKMTRRVNEVLAFSRAEQDKIIRRHEGEQNEAPAIAELEELLSLDVDWPFDTLKIDVRENIRLSCYDVDVLADIVEICGEEAGDETD